MSIKGSLGLELFKISWKVSTILVEVKITFESNYHALFFKNLNLLFLKMHSEALENADMYVNETTTCLQMSVIYNWNVKNATDIENV